MTTKYATPVPMLVPYPKHLPQPGSELTEEQLVRLRGEGWRLELVNGRLVVMSPASHPHGMVCANILYALGDWVRHGGGGAVLATDTGAQLGKGHVRAPDAMWVAAENWERAKEKREGFLPGAPDLAVEVLSPNDSYAETIERVQDQLSAGAKQVWLVDPRKRWVEIHGPKHTPTRLDEKKTLDGGKLMPGFKVKVAEFFKGI